MSRARRFFKLIAAAFLLTQIVLLAISYAPYRQIPQSVPNTNTRNYRSPIPPLIHQVFLFPEGVRNTHYRPSKYQMSWQTSQFAYTFYSDAAALTLIRNHLPEYLSTFNALP